GNKVARFHQKITNKREALQWKIAVKKVKKADAVFAEDLNISGMKSRCCPLLNQQKVKGDNVPLVRANGRCLGTLDKRW
ncbi:MAG: hypothetical protein AAGG00_20330, partial [Cyanobacteria bacterium P01_H01_bin.150]